MGAANPLTLSDTVTARLCHDLSGLVGTLMGMLELAEDEAGGDALGVATEAARGLGGRLRLLRAAWGGSGEARDAAFLGELLSHAAGYPRTRTDWSGCGPGPFGPGLARVLLNAALVGLESLPRGGVVRVSGPAAGPVRLALEGTGAAWPAAWAEAVPNGADRPIAVPAEPRHIQPALTLLHAHAEGVALSWDAQGGGADALLVSG